MDIAKLRDEFPTLSELAYLNAGTDGPLPLGAVTAAHEELARELRDGRRREHFERRGELAGKLRAGYAQLLGCDSADLALTSCTSEGIALVVGGLELGPHDEILTSDEEHPGLLGALAAARELTGCQVREVPLEAMAVSVGSATALVACCHVGWKSGAIAPPELAHVDAPVLLDGAQGVGAVPVDVAALGCGAYAGAGQKWLCGPDGTGMLYVSPALSERIAVRRRGYPNLADPDAGLNAGLHQDARRFDALGLSAEATACALAALRTLERASWSAIFEHARALAAELAERLTAVGRSVGPRGATTLVSFASPDPEAERVRLTAAGVIVRDIPGTPWLRASVGAWNNQADLERLLGALGN